MPAILLIYPGPIAGVPRKLLESGLVVCDYTHDAIVLTYLGALVSTGRRLQVRECAGVRDRRSQARSREREGKYLRRVHSPGRPGNALRRYTGHYQDEVRSKCRDPTEGAVTDERCF